MKTRTSLRKPSGAQDCALCWTMRIIGIVLTVSAVVFINQDIFTSELSTWFFGLCIGLGVVTTMTSFMPGPSSVRLPKETMLKPIVQPVVHSQVKRRKAA